MSEAKRLLEQATPLPWQWLIDSYEPAKVFITNDPNVLQDAIVEQVEQADAALIVYAVNHLPDYLAAVEALEIVLPWVRPPHGGLTYSAYEKARELLARLREKVPA